jgi:WD40 repeat protein
LAVAGFDRAFAVTLWDLVAAKRRSWLAESGSDAARARSTPAAGRYAEATVGVRAVAFSPDDATLAAACSDGVIRLWDVASGDLCRTLSGHLGSVNRLAFAPDGRTLASLGDDHMINLWHLRTGQRFFSLDTHGQELRGLAFSRDGRLLVAGARPGGENEPSALLMWRAESAGP